MEKVELSQGREEEEKVRAKNYFLFSPVHGQAKKGLDYFGYSLLTFFTVRTSDWLVNEILQGGKLFMLIIIHRCRYIHRYYYVVPCNVVGYDYDVQSSCQGYFSDERDMNIDCHTIYKTAFEGGSEGPMWVGYNYQGAILDIYICI